MKNKILNVWLLLMLITSLTIIPVSASVIDDANQWIDTKIKQTINNIQTLSLIGTQTVQCDDGTTTCGATGEIFTISSNVMTGDSQLDLVIPTSKTFTVNNQIITITAPLRLSLIPREPVLKIPLTSNTDYFYYRSLSPYPGVRSEKITTWTPYGDGLITTRYGIKIADKAGTSGIQEVSYNYQNPTQTNTVYVTDNAGNVATVTAKHQNSGGIVPNMNIIVVPDSNGVGGYSAFDRVSFSTKLQKQNNIEYWRLDTWNAPNSWQMMIDRLKSDQGLISVPLGNQNKYSVESSYINIYYTEDSIGTQVEARFPKTMVSHVIEALNNGEPQIVAASMSPPDLKFGQGNGLLTVVVKNVGSSDKISVHVSDSPYATATGGGTQTINSGATAFFTFTITPLSDRAASTSLRITATAAGSGKTAYRDVFYKISPSDPTAKKYQMSITALTPEGTVLSEAPIIVNSIQKCKGTCNVEVVDGTTYLISSANTSKYFAPTPVTRVVSGSTPEPVILQFTTTPPEENIDLTWLFWLGLIVLLVAIIYYTGIYKYIISIVMTPIGISVLLYGILAIIIILFLWGIYDAIVNFRLL